MNSLDDVSSPGDTYLSLLWIVPAGALLLLLFPIAIQAASDAGNFRFVHGMAVEMFKIMFWLTPAVGIGTILSILGLADVTRSIKRRAITFAGLDIVAPFVVIILGIVLSGFTR